MKSPLILAWTFLVTCIASLRAEAASFSAWYDKFAAHTPLEEKSTDTHNLRRKIEALSEIGNNGSPGGNFPLGKCEGDCDIARDECASGLECFERGPGTPYPAGTPIPGCSGSARADIDFCYDPNDAVEPPTTPPIQSTPAPMQPAQPPQSPSVMALKVVGNNGSPGGNFPLGKCEGDCDITRDECASGLECFERGPGTPYPSGTPIPGCSGSERADLDFCYDPNDAAAPPSAPPLQPTLPPSQPTPQPQSPTGDSFLLRMFWEEGYDWQEVLDETFWCMNCDSGQTCTAGEALFIRNCTATNTYFEYVGTGATRQIKNTGSNLCVSLVPNGSPFANANPPIRMVPCGNGDDLWETKGSGSFDGPKFEIHPNGETIWCITTHHHPKDGEEVRIERCGLARKDLSEFWYRYSVV